MTNLTELIEEARKNANQQGWFISWNREDPKNVYVGEALALMHTEISEALEEYRDNNKEKFGLEIADLLIRTFTLIGELNIPIEHFLQIKMELNKTRPYKHNRKVF